MPLYPDDDLDDWDDEVFDSDNDDETVPCPYCRKPIHEQAVRCPYCESYLSDVDAPSARRPWWVYAGVAVCLVIVLLWIVSLC